jgi:hypothetical protein
VVKLCFLFALLNKNASINDGSFVWNGRSARAYIYIYTYIPNVITCEEGRGDDDEEQEASFSSLWRKWRTNSWKSTKLILMLMTSDSQERQRGKDSERERNKWVVPCLVVIIIIFVVVVVVIVVFLSLFCRIRWLVLSDNKSCFNRASINPHSSFVLFLQF